MTDEAVKKMLDVDAFAKLIREAEARGMERAEVVALRATMLPPQYNMKGQWRAAIGAEIALAIRAEAAAIRRAAEETGT